MEEGKESKTGGTRQRLTRISYPLPCPSRLPCGNGVAPRGEPEAEGQEGERPGAAGMEDPEPGPLFRALRPRRRRAVTIPHNPGRPRARHGTLSHVGPGFVRPDQLWPFPAGGRGAPLAAGVQGSRRLRRRPERRQREGGGAAHGADAVEEEDEQEVREPGRGLGGLTKVGPDLCPHFDVTNNKVKKRRMFPILRAHSFHGVLKSFPA